MTPRYLNEPFAKALRDHIPENNILLEAQCPLDSLQAVLRFWRAQVSIPPQMLAQALPEDVAALLLHVGRAKDRAEAEVCRKAQSRK